ncbi:ATP-binding protein [Bacteroidetes/Chlorobi group bacterium MS-B_bin-24]|jgi:predicted HTH transcriptional regulator|nr:MAG: ATP-binding protein [Bacteroidetes/Chlorobi group bacterium MS-B_bin-24]
MDIEKLKEIIIEGESSTVEFKRKVTTAEKIAKELCAFANTKGGYLIIGVDDDRKVVGVDSEKSEIDIIEIACQFTIYPPITPKSIEVINYNKKDIIVVEIEESNNKPHTIEGIDEKGRTRRFAYIRIGEKSVVASKEMKRLLSGLNANSKPMKIYIGEQEKRLFDYLEKHEKITVREFAKLVNISERRASAVLVKLVRVGVLQIFTDMNNDYFGLA